jgi:hypothetical protein
MTIASRNSYWAPVLSNFLRINSVKLAPKKPGGENAKVTDGLDGLHTYDHMLWEYRTAFPYLRPDGLLFSDDAAWNSAILSRSSCETEADSPRRRLLAESCSPPDQWIGWASPRGTRDESGDHDDIPSIANLYFQRSPAIKASGVPSQPFARPAKNPPNSLPGGSSKSKHFADWICNVDELLKDVCDWLFVITSEEHSPNSSCTTHLMACVESVPEVLAIARQAHVALG